MSFDSLLKMIRPLLVFATLSISGSVAADNQEKWDSLSLRDSHLTATPPIAGEVDQLPEFSREMTMVQWRAGDPIYLFIIKPKGVLKPPVILHLYSYPSETDRFMNNSYCKLAIKDGFAAVGFVSALTGHRYNARPMKEWFVSELQESIGSTVHDVEMILNYLDTRADLDARRVGMFGEGSGGTVAILAAAADSRLKAIDVVDPWGDWPDWFAHSTGIPEDERPDFLKPAFLKELEPLDPIRWFGKVSVPVRFQYFSKASVTPQIARERIRQAAPPQSVIVTDEQALATLQASKGRNLFDWIKGQKAFESATK